MNRVFLVLFFSLSLLLSSSSGGVLTGKIKNGTAGYTVPSEIKVEINEYRSNGQNPAQKTLGVVASVDSKGRFMFTDVPEDSNVAYEPMVTYKGIKYYGRAVSITKKQARAQSDIIIYETTQSDSNISALRHHMILSPGEGFLNIKEVVVFENKGDRTYIGKGLAKNGKFRTITYKLPPDAKEVQLGKGAMSCCIEFEQSGFYDTMEFPPGKKQITYFYRIDAPEKTLKISKPITFSTMELDIIPLDPAIQITGPNIKETALTGTRTRMFVATGLNKASVLTLNISGLKGKPFNASYLFFGIFTGLLLIGFFMVYLKIKKNRRNVPEEKAIDAGIDKKAERERLVRKIALLDVSFESGELEESEYKRQREELKKQVKNLQKSN